MTMDPLQFLLTNNQVGGGYPLAQVQQGAQNDFQLNGPIGGAFAGLDRQNLQDTLERNFRQSDTEDTSRQLALQQQQKNQPVMDAQRKLEMAQLGQQQKSWEGPEAMGPKLAVSASQAALAKNFADKSQADMAKELNHAAIGSSLYQMTQHPSFDWTPGSTSMEMLKNRMEAAGMKDIPEGKFNQQTLEPILAG